MQKVKYIQAFLFTENAVFTEALKQCESIWGETDYCSAEYRFDMTDYYQAELGQSIRRRFVSFAALIDASDLAEIKIQSGLLEGIFARDGRRRINIDPGYMDLDKVILASVKYARQKIYIGQDIYADPVLHFYSGTFRSFDWSFPDFKSDRYYQELAEIRRYYKEDLRESGKEGAREA